MARIKTPRFIELDFTGSKNLDGLHARLTSIKFGKVRQLIALMDEDDKDVEVMDEISGLLAKSLVSWDLLEADGVTPVEPTAEAIDDLEFDEVIEIVNRWLDQMTGPSDELGKDSPSGASFPGQPLTMEAL